jgi:hypothetical protein
MRRHILAVTLPLAHLQPKTLRVGFTGCGQLHLLL